VEDESAIRDENDRLRAQIELLEKRIARLEKAN
jgi:hypothetical protein